MHKRQHHWTAWLTIAGTILAGLSLPAYAQYPGSPSDNSLGVMPMYPTTAPSQPPSGDGYGIVPKPPVEPKTTTRPAGWVGGTAAETVANNNAPPPDRQSIQNPPADQYPSTGSAPQTPPQGYPVTAPNSFAPPPNSPTDQATGQPRGFDLNPAPKGALNQSVAPFDNPQLTQGTVILARVGSEGIFASEITPKIDQYFAQYKNKISPQEFELQRDQFEIQRELFIKNSLKSAIEAKLIQQDAKRQIPPEGMASVEKQLDKKFLESEVPKLMKEHKTTTTKELDQKLKTLDSSLALQKKAYFEKNLIQGWLAQQIKPNEEATVAEMIRYYNAHLADFTKPAKARWEELTASKTKYPTSQAAYGAIAQMGNRALIGTTLANVAKQGSDGITAQKGGIREWVEKGSLADEEIEKAVFGLPVGRLSQIIETPRDYTILRVVERVEQKTVPFLEAQSEIREKIKQERNNRQVREYLDGLEKRTPIWTVYDGTGNNLRLAERLNEKQR